MRKTLTVLALTTALTGAPAVAGYAAHAAPPVTEEATTTGEENDGDKTGLWGLLGLLGLAGLARRRETADHSTGTTGTHR